MSEVSIGTRKPIVRTFRYDFAALGGAIGALNLTDQARADAKLPDNAVVTRAWLEGVTTPTSAGAATIALGFTGSAAAFKAATAYTDATFVADAASAANATVPLKTNAAAGVNVIATIAVAALTAGKFDVHVEYIPGS